MMKQSIFGRIAQLTRANINALIDQAEDPQKMLDQMVRDYTENIREAEAAVAQTIGQLRMLEQDHDEDVREAVASHTGDGEAWALAERMRERVAALGGSLQVQSAKGEGTVLIVRVPLAAATTPLPPGVPPSLVQDGAA